MSIVPLDADSVTVLYIRARRCASDRCSAPTVKRLLRTAISTMLRTYEAAKWLSGLKGFLLTSVSLSDFSLSK